MEDANEDRVVESFFAETCHCTLGKDTTLWSQVLTKGMQLNTEITV